MILSKIIQEAINEMPDVFTSVEVNTEALRLGYPETLLKHNGLHEYLRNYAENQGRYSKTWIKKTSKIYKDMQEKKAQENKVSENKVSENSSFVTVINTKTAIDESYNVIGLSEKEMVARLKTLGYKIMKPSWSEC